MAAFVAYDPLDTLKPVAENVWIVDGPEIGMAYLGTRMPFPTRMTIVRLPNESLWIHSPTEAAPDLFDRVAALGPVAHIIAPNTLHYWWVPEWAARFPGARVHLAPGLDRKAKRPLPPHETLSGKPPPAWAALIEQLVVNGDVLTEVDFFHRPSRTAILTDLIENFEPARIHSRFLRMIVRWSGAADPRGSAPIDMRLTFLRHRKAVRAAAERMIAWAPERVILAHGRWYDRDGAAELRRAFHWAGVPAKP
ncbi:MAG: DUF4336 domain-containing protein [Sphingomonas sp.]